MSKVQNPDSLIGRAVAALVNAPDMTQNDFARLVGKVCETAEEAQGLRNRLSQEGYVQYRVVVTDRARKRVQA